MNNETGVALSLSGRARITGNESRYFVATDALDKQMPPDLPAIQNTQNGTRSDTHAPTTANGSASTSTGAPTTPKPETARLINFGDLLREFGDDAQAANEARKSGLARGPVSGLGSLDRELSGAWLSRLAFVTRQRRSG